jgi:hypothetical protein
MRKTAAQKKKKETKRKEAKQKREIILFLNEHG